MDDRDPPRNEVLDYATSSPRSPKQDRGITWYLAGWLLALAIAVMAIFLLIWMDNAFSRSFRD